MQAIAAKTLKVSEFLSVAIQLCRESAIIIRDVQKTGNLEKVMKGKDDPLTVADLKAQTVIFRGFQHFFPGITLVGEEDEDFTGELGVDFTKLNRNLLPFEIFTNSSTSQLKEDEELNLEEVTVYVDPLDATLSFTKNELENITTLIGLAYKNSPYLGVVGQPFRKKAEQDYEFAPKIYFSHSKVSKIFYLRAEEVENGRSGLIPWELKRNNSNDLSPDRKLRVVISNTRYSESLEKEVLALGASEIRRVGGSGNKLLQVAQGLTDCYYYHLPGTKRWDTCANEALLASFGGVITDKEGNPYDYSRPKDKASCLNEKGLLAMVDRAWHKEVLAKLIALHKK